ncbi:hypothetical protein [Beijerinckia sp. L45]|nr:hypothetical protein [Beijerinckia sp. L45]
MNAFQVFGFIALPVIIAVGGWIVAFIVAPPERIGHTKSPAEHSANRA